MDFRTRSQANAVFTLKHMFSRPRHSVLNKMKRPVQIIRDHRPKLEAYGRKPEPQLNRVMRWLGLGVLSIFALIGLASLVKIWIPVAPAATVQAQVAASAPAPDPTPDVAAVPTNVDHPTIETASDPTAGAAASGAPGLDLTANKEAAEEELKARLPEIDGVQYKDVKTNLSTTDGEQKVDFCGEVNSLNPMGVYIGFQRFISSRFDARVEQGMSPGEFDQAWQARCSGTEGPKVWN